MGPHRQQRPKWQSPKTMILTTVATTDQSKNPSKIVTKIMRIPWSSKRKQNPTKILKTTTSTPVVTSNFGGKLSHGKSFKLKKS